jgi:hypothetical protein
VAISCGGGGKSLLLLGVLENRRKDCRHSHSRVPHPHYNSLRFTRADFFLWQDPMFSGTASSLLTRYTCWSVVPTTTASTHFLSSFCHSTISPTSKPPWFFYLKPVVGLSKPLRPSDEFLPTSRHPQRQLIQGWSDPPGGGETNATNVHENNPKRQHLIIIVRTVGCPVDFLSPTASTSSRLVRPSWGASEE